ncbi:DUF4845 domain-containing protein [Candidatus Ferrigenium straubiae]|jgi:hypothetical protein|uniref:DUF4845 domain-containing protein n=1 Tax=Candidatus Ferrigenium straubiae TaxID=2919506 RepID=UPI003F4AD764
MNKAMPARQRGLTFSGFIFGAFILVLASIGGLKLIPAYMEEAKISNLFTVIANDPEMQKASPRDIRMSFAKRASIDNITVITPEDIEINSSGSRMVLSASYAVKIPLVANVSLYLEFSPTGAK